MCVVVCASSLPLFPTLPPLHTHTLCLIHLDVGAALLHHGAGVGDAGALHLQVGQALQLVVGQGVCGLQHGRLRVCRQGERQRCG